MHVLSAPRRPMCLWTLAIAATLACAMAQAQTWNYKSYKRGGMGGQPDKDRFTVGTISLQEKDGQASFTMTAGTVDACHRGSIPATVTRSDETTIIELQTELAGCDKVRYVIRNDGSGGHREQLRGEKWVKGRFDHDLTPVR